MINAEPIAELLIANMRAEFSYPRRPIVHFKVGREALDAICEMYFPNEKDGHGKFDYTSLLSDPANLALVDTGKLCVDGKGVRSSTRQ